MLEAAKHIANLVRKLCSRNILSWNPSTNIGTIYRDYLYVAGRSFVHFKAEANGTVWSAVILMDKIRELMNVFKMIQRDPVSASGPFHVSEATDAHSCKLPYII